MSTVPSRRVRPAFGMGLAGAVLGIGAGLTQVLIGSRIPDWSGAKQAPIPLGLLTVVLSLVALLAAARQRDPDLSVLARAACAVGLVGPALVCLTTVGRLWYAPAVLLGVAGVLTIHSWRRTGAAVAAEWFRVLLSALAVCQLLMAAGSPPLTAAVGAASGVVLLLAAWLRAPRGVTWALLALGTVPFAVLTWTAVVPVVLTVVAVIVNAAIPSRVQEV